MMIIIIITIIIIKIIIITIIMTIIIIIITAIIPMIPTCGGGQETIRIHRDLAVIVAVGAPLASGSSRAARERRSESL